MARIAITAIIASSPPWSSSPHRHHDHHRLIAIMAIMAIISWFMYACHMQHDVFMLSLMSTIAPPAVGAQQQARGSVTGTPKPRSGKIAEKVHGSRPAQVTAQTSGWVST